MKKLGLIISFLHIAALLCAQVISFSAATDKSRIVIGEQFNLVIKTVFDSKQSSKVFSPDSLPHFEILSTSKPDSLEQGNDLVVQQTIVLTSWDSGRWMIPSFSYAGKTSRAIPVTVSFSPFDPAQDYHDIKEIIEVEKPPRNNWYWYLLGLLLVIVLVALLFPGNKKPEAVTEAPPKITYGSRDALNAIEKLEKEYDSLTSKIFYTELVDILRSYLRLRLETDPFTTATAMLGDKIAGMDAPTEVKKEIAIVLVQSDLAKFARHEAAGAEKKNALLAVKKLIQSTDNRR